MGVLVCWHGVEKVHVMCAGPESRYLGTAVYTAVPVTYMCTHSCTKLSTADGMSCIVYVLNLVVLEYR